MSYKQELHMLQEVKIQMNEEIKAKLNKRLQTLAYFMFENTILRSDIERIAALQQQYKEHITLKPRLDAELESTIRKMKRLESETEAKLASLKQSYERL